MHGGHIQGWCVHRRLPKRLYKTILIFGLFILGLFGVFVFAQQKLSDNSSVFSAKDYSPNLWFDSEETYFPTNPLDFYFSEGKEISGVDAVKKYNNLPKTEKLENSSVFYYEKDLGSEIVFEYWLFYVFNDYENAHYGDWESIFVFVDKETKNINKIIASAHGSGLELKEVNSSLRNSWAYVGNGSHANCPDYKPDGKCVFWTWMVAKQGRDWSQEDIINGPKLSYNDYKLIKIDSAFIEKFNNQKSFDSSKSPDLGINLYKIIPLGDGSFYIDFPDSSSMSDPFGKTPTFAWAKEEYENPNQISPSVQQQNLLDSLNDFFVEKPREFFVSVGSFVNNTVDNFVGGVGGFFSGFRLFEASIEPIDELNQLSSPNSSGEPLQFPSEGQNPSSVIESYEANSSQNGEKSNESNQGVNNSENNEKTEEGNETLLSPSPEPSQTPFPIISPSPFPSPSPSDSPAPTVKPFFQNLSLQDILISEVCSGLDNSQNEFVELYNPTEQYVSLSNENFKLKLVNSKNEITSKRIEWKNQSIPPKGHFLFVAGNIGGVSSDANFSGQLTDASGVIITDGYGETKDRLSWGKQDKQPPQNAVSGSGIIVESGLNTDESLERKVKENSTWLSLAKGGEDFDGGNGYNTGNNLNDFVLQLYPNPENSRGEINANAPPSQGYYSSGGESQSGEKFIVSRVIDGDTIEISNGQRVRLVGINSPESDQCFFQQAKDGLKNLVEGKEVVLTKDISEKDKYDRLLRYIYLDNIFINDYLVNNGFAFAESVSPDTKYKIQFKQSQEYAKSGKSGLWGLACAPFVEAGENKTVSINQSITFDASGSSDNTDIISFRWDINSSDGLGWDNSDFSEEEFNFSSGYSVPGQYTVTLSVEDNSGNFASDTLLVDVLPEPKILITEIQIGGQTSDNDFIEIFNPTDSPRDISGFQLKKRTRSGTESSVNVFPSNSEIVANGYFLWANSENGYDENISADISSTSYLAENNSIAIFDSDKNILDKLSWGDEQEDPFVETSTFSQNPQKNQSLERKKDESGKYVDQNDNSQDFFLQLSPNPQGKNSGSNSSDGQGEENNSGNTVPIMSISPVVLDFTSMFESNPPQKSFTISNIGGGDLEWTTPVITDSWIDLDVFSGKILAGQSQQVSVSLNVSDKPIGNYSSKIIIGSKEISVNLIISEKPSEIILADHVVINEVQIEKEEFVRLYNSTEKDIKIGGWKLYYGDSRSWEFPEEAEILAKSFYLIGVFGYANTDWDLKTLAGRPYKTGQFSDGKSIFISDKERNIVDMVGWGDSEKNETESAPKPDQNQSIIRLEAGHDTDNNFNDFKIKDLDESDFSKVIIPVPFIKISKQGGDYLDIIWGIENEAENDYLDSFVIEFNQTDGVWQSWEISNEEESGKLKRFEGAKNETVYNFRIQAENFSGRKSEWKELSVNFVSSPILINEVAWGGEDKFIEFFNKTNQEISLGGWSLKYFWHPTKVDGDEYFLISFSDSDKIPAGGYFLYSGEALSDLGKDANQKLKLFNSNDDVIDMVLINGSGDWKKGLTEGTSIERVSKFSSGGFSKNWLESVASTPGAKNSVDGLYTFLTGDISGIIKKERSPYLISSFCDINGGCGMVGGLNVQSGEVLNIEAGSILKFENGGIGVNGTLLAEGTEGNPIVFTSILDSDFGGTGVDESNIWHYWNGIYFGEESINSVLNNVEIKYTADPNYESRSFGVKVVGSSINIKDSLIEDGSGPGLWFINSDSIVDNVNFVNLNRQIISDSRLRGEGALLMCGMSPEVKNSYFENNKIGIKIGFTINECSPNDSGLEIKDGYPTIENNEFVKNKDPIVILSAKYIPKIVGNYGSGNTNNGIKISGFVSKNSILYKNDGFPYISENSFGVSGENISLDVLAGANIHFVGDGNIFLASNGILNIAGTESDPVIFSTCRDGSSCWGSDFWNGVLLENINSGVEIKNLKIKHAGRAGGPAAWNLPVPSLKITNSQNVYLENVIIEDYVEKIIEIDDSSSLREGSTVFTSKNGESPIPYPL